MKSTAAILVAAGIAATQGFAQKPEYADEAVAKAARAVSEVQSNLAEVQSKMTEAQAKAQAKMATMDLEGFKELKLNIEGLQDFKGEFEGLKALKGLESTLAMDLAGMKAGMNLQIKRYGGGDGAYESGARLLDERKYDEAILRFNSVIEAKSNRADGALYWKGYALNRLGRRDEALATLSALRRDFPQSHWLNDAQALEAEVRQNSGQGASPADETNEDLKLMAINSLMNADPERAIPLLENLLKGSSAPRVKDRAMFVLTQSRAPRAAQILSDFAKGAGNPDLQLRAIRYIGMSGTTEAQQQLVAVYGATTDATVKREILRSLVASRGRDPLFNLAKSEKDPDLRLEAIRQLGAMRSGDQLVQLYASETSADNKVQILRSMMAAGASDKLLEIAKNEKDPKVKSEAIRAVATSHSTPVETLAQLYSSDTDPKTKRDLVNGLHARGDAKPLIELARKEQDPAMKRYIVERLSVMHSKEATDYMLELLK